MRPVRAASTTIGIDIGGTSVRAGLVDGDGRVLRMVRAATPDSVTATEDLFVSLIAGLAAGRTVTAVGLAVAGFISADRQRVRFAPHLAWRDAEVPARIADRVDLPVVMDHDVNAAAWTEYLLGAAVGSRSALLIALGTGIGAGLVLDGEIYRGAHGVAPELGHLPVVPNGRECPCGKNGCLERYCSGTALARTASEMVPSGGTWTGPLAEAAAGRPDRITGTMVGQAARAGDPLALAAVADLADWLGTALAIAVDMLDPALIVIGGGVAALGDLLLPAAIRAGRERATGGSHRLPAVVRTATFGDSAAWSGQRCSLPLTSGSESPTAERRCPIRRPGRVPCAAGRSATTRRR